MSEYNPIVRTFNRLRAAILATTDVPRCRIRPSAVFDTLVPADRRDAVWAEFHRGRPAPPSPAAASATTVFCLLVLGLVGLVSLPVLLPVCLVSWVLSRGVSTRPEPHRMTVGEWAVSHTRFPEHKASGYRPSRGDVALKVRLMFADHFGLPLDQVREDSRIVDLDC